MKVYAIGDIHGQLDMLRAAHGFIAEDRRNTGDHAAPVVHLGDYGDRGPDTKGVIDFLLAGMGENPWICLKGNHDRMMQLYLDHGTQDPRLRPDLTWLHPRLGGQQALDSYGGQDHVPQAHRDFLAQLDLTFETDDLFFCHAGVKPGVPLSQQSEDDLIWIRAEFHNDTRDHGKLIVHGHTPVDTPEHHGNRVALDTGAGYGAPLTCAVFEGRVCHILGPNGRVPLQPQV